MIGWSADEEKDEKDEEDEEDEEDEGEDAEDEEDEEEDQDDEEEEETPTGGAYRCQVRKWTHGNYTLLHDAETDERGSLDMFMYFFSEASAGLRASYEYCFTEI